jgi:hypothetical protein
MRKLAGLLVALAAAGCGDGAPLGGGTSRVDAGARRADAAARAADGPVARDAGVAHDAARDDARIPDGVPDGPVRDASLAADAARAPADGPQASCPAQPVADPDWLAAFQERIVGELSGHVALSDGTRLRDRHTPANRARARDYLGDLWREIGFSPRRQDYDTGTNVYADLAATVTTDQYLVLGAHFDGVQGSPGANDNATGVALVYAVARQLAAVPCRAMNVRFVLFDQEEIGLVGSFHFASLLDQSSTERIVAAHTVDQMGWDADDNRLIELERPDTGLFALYQAGVMAGGFSIPLRRTDTNTTDHARFREFGFDAVGLTEGYVSGDTTPHYHLPTDTYATVDFAYLGSTTRFVSFLLANDLREPAPPTPRSAPVPTPTFVPMGACRSARLPTCYSCP